MKITVIGHSLIHPRQYKFFDYLNTLENIEVQQIYPKKWGNLTRTGGFEVKNEGHLGTFEFNRDAFLEIKKFKPDILYCMQELWSKQASNCFKKSKIHGCKLAYFIWENITQIQESPLSPPITSYYTANSSGTLANEADLIVCGNHEAQDIVKRFAKKTVVLPQVGIDTDLFSPVENPATDKDLYNIVYLGREVPEKGISYIKAAIENTKYNLNLITGLTYEQVPQVLNKAFLMITYPYDTPDWKPQFEYNIGESMSCGTPVITSDSGAIPDIYGESPARILPQRSFLYLEEEIKIYNRMSYKDYPLLCKYGREWVIKNLSYKVVGEKLLRALRGIL